MSFELRHLLWGVRFRVQVLVLIGFRVYSSLVLGSGLRVQISNFRQPPQRTRHLVSFELRNLIKSVWFMVQSLGFGVEDSAPTAHSPPRAL